MNPGNIILLSGGSQAAKAAIIQELQSIFDVPYLHIPIEKYSSRQSSHESEGPQQEDATLHHLRSNIHLTIASLARAGNPIVADYELIDSRWLRECANLYCELPALLVCVRSSQEGIETPEQGAALHTLPVYDLEIDSSLFDPHQCACLIRERLIKGPSPLAWHWLKAWTDPVKHGGWIRAGAES